MIALVLLAQAIFSTPRSVDFLGSLEGCPPAQRLPVDFRGDGKPFTALVLACPEVADRAAEARRRCEADIDGGRIYARDFTVEQCAAQEGATAPAFKGLVRGGLRILDPAGGEVLSFSVAESEGLAPPEVLRLGGRELLLVRVLELHDEIPLLLGWVRGGLRAFDDEGVLRALPLRRGEALRRGVEISFSGGAFRLLASVYADHDALCCPSRGGLRAALVPVLATGRFRVARAIRTRR